MIDVLKQALDALEAYSPLPVEGGWFKRHHKAITNLRAAIEQMKAEDLLIDSGKQNWKGMSGAVAWHLIERHADGWPAVGAMMEEWLAANTAPVAPTGWKLVPAEPTEEMLKAGYFEPTRANSAIYKSMLAAAPEYEP